MMQIINTESIAGTNARKLLVKKRVILTCEQCSQKYERQEWHKSSKYCSNTCWHSSMKSDIISCVCAHCSKPFLRKEHLVNKSKNVFCTKKCADRYNCGNNHYEWKYNLHEKNLKTALRQWAILIKERDSHTCIDCGNTDKNVLQAHHIIPRSEKPELVFDLGNGETLCLWCHLKRHISHVNAARLIMLKIEKYKKK